MIGRRAARNIVVAVAWLAVGCSDPCDQLAARTCSRVGAADKLCLQLQAIAAAPRHGDEESCRAGNAFVDELQRVR